MPHILRSRIFRSHPSSLHVACFGSVMFAMSSCLVWFVHVSCHYLTTFLGRDYFLPLNYFPSGGLGFRRYLSRYDSLRVFTLWHGGHNHCRLLSSSVPPRAWLMMWSSSKGSPSPQCAHWYGSWYLACCLIFFHAPVDVRLLPFSHAIYIIPMLS